MKFKALSAAIIAASILTACGSDNNNDDKKKGGDTDAVKTISFKQSDLANIRKVLNTNADIAYAAYSDSVKTAEALKTALATLKTTPTQANLDAARKAWLIAREPYGQTEVYRFRKSPIDSTDYNSEDGPEGDINAWPLGEALIDYVVTGGDFESDQVGVTTNSAGINQGGAITADQASESKANNIIGQTSITINSDLLSKTATASDEHDVIAGYHAIEFLLWGQDLNKTKTVTDGTNRNDAVKTYGAGEKVATAGQRPVSDFVQTQAIKVAAVDSAEVISAPTSSALANRRHKYLEVAVDKLIADLKQVRDGWAKDDADNYRAKFTTITTVDEGIEKLTEIMNGMGTLSKGELAGERMKIAYVGNSQEDEHSCFSDNTHRDIWLNAEGVSNSYYGVYAGYDHDLDPTTADTSENAVTNGYGIDDLLASVTNDTVKALKTKLESALSETETNYKAIDSSARAGKPFDVLIMDNERSTTNPVAKTILSLNAQANVIAEAGELLKLGEVVDKGASDCDTSNTDTDDC